MKPNTIQLSTAPIAGEYSISIVVPCYNEEEVLPETAKRLILLADSFRTTKKPNIIINIYFVDDGSKDQTWAYIEQLSASHSCIRGFKLSRNQGHQNALMAGLLNAEGDAVISIDADLQDDLDAIKSMIAAFLSGYEIVYGVREQRKKDSFFKRFTAESYYRLLAAMGVDLVFNHADYRLMSRRAIESLRNYSEVNLFLRGIIPQLGYSSTKVYYDRVERFAGKSKYPLKKMLEFAWQGITSFSTAPLRLITGLGFLISVGSFCISIWAIYIKMTDGATVPGWTSTVVPMYFLGGIQLFSLGIIGEYLAKVYMETKRRPPFFIEKTTPLLEKRNES